MEEPAFQNADSHYSYPELSSINTCRAVIISRTLNVQVYGCFVGVDLSVSSLGCHRLA